MRKKVILFGLIVLIIIIVIIVTVSIYKQSPTPYLFVLKWAIKDISNSQAVFPIAIAVDSGNNVFVADLKNNNIQKFTSEGEFLLSWSCENKITSGYNEYYHIRDICIDSKDNIYVAAYNQIQKFNSNGDYLDIYEVQGGDSCNVIAIDLENNFYIGRFMKVQKLDSIWNLIGTFDIWRWMDPNCLPSGLSEKKIKVPASPTMLASSYTDIEVDSAGYIYVVYTEFTKVLDNLNENTSLLVLRNYEQSIIYKATLSGDILEQWGNIPEKDSNLFSCVYGIAIDPDGRVFVADTGNNRILILDSNGRLITQFGSRGFWEKEFLCPVDITIDTADNVYVLDYGDCWIQKFAPNPDYKPKNTKKEE